MRAVIGRWEVSTRFWDGDEGFVVGDGVVEGGEGDGVDVFGSGNGGEEGVGGLGGWMTFRRMRKVSEVRLEEMGVVPDVSFTFGILI